MSSEAFSDYVVGHGELWSAKLLTLCCKQMGADVAFMDTREVLIVTPTADGTSVDLNEDVSNGKVRLNMNQYRWLGWRRLAMLSY